MAIGFSADATSSSARKLPVRTEPPSAEQVNIYITFLKEERPDETEQKYINVAADTFPLDLSEELKNPTKCLEGA